MARGGPPIQPDWGRTIQQKREQRGWSLRDAGRRAGMSDVFWAQMERGYKRSGDDYIPVTPSLGSLLQAAAALRLSDKEVDALVTSAGHPSLPRRFVAGEQRPTSVVDAIESDPNLLDEAKAHLLNQYELLLRVAPQPSLSATAGTQKRRTPTPSGREGLRAVAHGGDPADRAEIGRRARKVREQHDNGEGKGNKK